MAVRRVVANIGTDCPDRAQGFYGDILGMRLVMDHGWIATFASDVSSPAQVSIASQGGSGAPVPDLSIEVDDWDDVLARITEAGIALEYGPVSEPWGVRRFYVRDPFADC